MSESRLAWNAPILTTAAVLNDRSVKISVFYAYQNPSLLERVWHARTLEPFTVFTASGSALFGDIAVKTCEELHKARFCMRIVILRLIKLSPKKKENIGFCNLSVNPPP
jgi:hypothetical protein